MTIAPPVRTGISARIRDLSVFFSGRPAVRDISLDLPARGVTVVMGKSGVGKTTLLRALNRLNEEFPGCETRGEVWLDFGDGLENIYSDAVVDVTEIRRRVGMVFQTPAVLPLSVRKNMTLPLRYAAGLREREIAERMEQALREAALWDEVSDRLNAPASDLSGGQRQRLCLARALALEPLFLLLDEPTASLDPRAAETIEELLRKLSRTRPLVVVSHSMEQAYRLADRCAVLSADGAARVFSRDELPDRKELALLLA